MFRKIYILFILGAALACKAAPHNDPPVKVPGSNDLQPDAQQSVVCQTIARFISDYNYKKVELNDSISAVVYNKYIKSLDENHNYLLASDIQDFDKFKTGLDDDLKNGNLSNVFYMFNVYQKRYNERVKYSIAQLDKNYDFTTKETFTYDRDSLPYAANTDAMNKIWNERVKYDLLNLMLANNDAVKNKATLKTRYENLLSQSNKLNNQDVFQIFMDAFTNAIDPHTNYFNPSNAANFNIEMSRSLEGIGATLRTENDFVTITSVVPGGPADKSHQISAEDHIV
ncbi:MAG: tail-specific protease, partial [Mucilaginibacter sp.]